MTEFGELVKETRERKNIRAYDLAYSIGLNPSWISRLEAGSLTHPPAPDVMRLLSESLGLSTASMFEAMGYAMTDVAPGKDVQARIAELG